MELPTLNSLLGYILGLHKDVAAKPALHACTLSGFSLSAMVWKRTKSAVKIHTKKWRQFTLIFLFLSACVGESTSALCEENQKWSFHFKNTPISEALDELCRTTGIDIFFNQLPAGRCVTRRYVEQGIEEIVRDLFQGLSFGLVWYQGQNGIDAIDIWILDGGGGKSPTFSRRERPVSENPALRYGRKAPTTLEKDEDTEEREEAEVDVDHSPSQSSAVDEESEKKDNSGPDEESDMELDVVDQSQPGDESGKEQEKRSRISIKKPVFE